MDSLLTSFFFISIGTTVLSVLVAITIWTRRHVSGAIYLMWQQIVVAIWALAGGFEIIAQTIPQKIFWSKVSYIGIAGAVLFYLLFAIEFAQIDKILPANYPYYLGVFPAISLVIAWLYPHTHILWTDVQFREGTNIAIYSHGWYFGILTAYIYLQAIAASYILIRSAIRFPNYFKLHIIVILLGAIFPVAGNILYVFGFNPIPGVEWTPLGFSITGILISWAIFSQDMFKLMPVARNQVIEEMKDGLFVVDGQRRIIDINPTAREIFSMKGEDIIGRDINTLIPIWDSYLFSNPDGEVPTEYQIDDSDQVYELSVSMLKAWRGHELGYLVIMRDITRRKETESALIRANNELTEKLKEIKNLQSVLREQAIRDPLTALYNRRYLEEAMSRELPRAIREKYNLGLVILDIDDFKYFNDTHGHLAGDLLLTSLAEILDKNTREGDIICRYGGEEFVILMPYIHVQIVYKRVEELRVMFEKTIIDFGNVQLGTTISLGVSIFPHHGFDSETLIHRADIALYQAKASGKNCTVIWTEEMEQSLIDAV